MFYLIFANGVLTPGPAVDDAIAEYERLRAQRGERHRARIIAANGGSKHVHALGLRPDVIIGDVDSLPDPIRDAFADVPKVAHPPEKDSTDLALALDWAYEREARWIRVIGAAGARLDQTLAAVGLLDAPDNVDVRLVNAGERAWLFRGQTALFGSPGDTLSLIPWGGDAVGVTTEGLYYPLRAETLPLGTTRGISNVMEGAHAEVTVAEGALIAVHTRGRA
jgi:thiamine pyrophosphokinase